MRGGITSINLTPKLVRSDSTVQDMRIEQRGCRFAHETEGLELLKEYSEAGCKFECKLRQAREKCGCTPWDYPHPKGRKI